MSAFEVNITPTRSNARKRIESREPTEVMMAPFSSKAIVQFEDVPVTKSAKRLLRIFNPTEEDIEVKVTQPIRTEHNITVSWSEQVIPALGEVIMEVVWNPELIVACKETMQLTDNRNFRKDVMFILKSKSNKPPKSTRKFPTISSNGSSHTKSHPLKSPKGTAMAKHKEQRKRYQQLDIPKPQIVPEIRPKNPVQVPTKSHGQKVSLGSGCPLTQQNVYLSNRCVKVSPNAIIDDLGKENISPLTPNSVLNLIDKMNFTPALDERPSCSVRRLDNLAYLPTPIRCQSPKLEQAHENIHTVRPRRLLDADLIETGEYSYGVIPEVKVEMFDETKISATIISNKTFEVKPSEELDSFMDIADSPLTEGRLSCNIVLNKTTTIAAATPARHLEMIQEEEANSPPAEAHKTHNLQVASCEAQKFKRDINLIATPLRKFSESMQDLSLKSPQSKFSSQGSMPNLNDMDKISSIDQNRYFYNVNSGQGMSIIQEHNTVPRQSNTQSVDVCDEAFNLSQASLLSGSSDVVGHELAEVKFIQSEILAQSSRFNLNEIGVKSRKSSPIKYTFKGSQKQSQENARLYLAKKMTTPEKEVGNQKRKSHELSGSNSPSTESVASTDSMVKKSWKTVSPPKRQRVDSEFSFQRPTPVNASSTRIKHWSQIQPKSLRLSKTLSLVKKPITPRKMKNEERIKLYDSDLYLQSCINPDPFAATTTCDPFLASTMYLDERAVDKHHTDFKKWLNALVTIPADLEADCNTKIDVGKLFNEVRHKDLILAPTKEEHSMNYLTKFRLESLRRAAVQLFLSEEMRTPCSKVAVYVNKNAIRIRSDRNLHLDVVMQRYILELLLCFNPLWLRLGLEVVYGEKIHLHSNSDIVGLSTFILNRLFRDKFLEQKYSKAYTLSDEYANHIKKFTLQKMLFLLLFLDKAKNQHIIKHNPCLFVKNSPHKETRDILLKFSTELLANIGDITRDLKRLGYMLQHKQSFLDEFDYAFNNLAVDLRDGIRLTRVMEIILLREDLSKQLRVPAISRLQRVYNVNLALKALNAADFHLKGEITAADIVDGHREKTLSLLWQVIYMFRSPKFHAAARMLQTWWRHSWLRVVVRRRIHRKAEIRRETAATRIQALFRGYVTRKYAKVYREERTQAAVVLQKYARRFLARRHVARAMSAVVFIQNWYRAQLLGSYCRQQFLALRNGTIFVQRCFRRRMFAQKLLQAAAELKIYRQQKHQAAAKCIQNFWCNYCEMKRARDRFLSQRRSAIVLQRRFRAKKDMQRQREGYLRLRQAVLYTQRTFRANKRMSMQRTQYLHVYGCIVKVQQRRRALLKMRSECAAYVQQRSAIITIQRRFRATQAMKLQRAAYLKKRTCVCTIQEYYRAHLAMKQQRSVYQQTRVSIIRIQLKWRATLLARQTQANYLSLMYHTTILQQKFRSTKTMRLQHAAYQKLKATVVYVQRRYRAKLLMRQQRADFVRKRQAVLALQRRFRAYKQMRFARAKYRGTKAAVSCLQQHFRGYLQMKRERAQFLQQRRAAVVIQGAFRALLLMRQMRSEYERLKLAAVSVQQRYRGKLQTRHHMQQFQRERTLIVLIQRRFRGKSLTRLISAEFAQKRQIVIKLQRRFRATRLMHSERAVYLSRRSNAIKIQRHFRSFLRMKRERATFQQQRRAVSRLQTWYRSVLFMRRDQQSYQALRDSAIKIQRRWRATRAAHVQRRVYEHTVQQIVLVQRRIRATLKMRMERLGYLRLRAAAVLLQRSYRSRHHMLKIRSQFLLIRSLTICIQRKFRANQQMLVQRKEFLLLKHTTIHLQQRFRGRIKMQEERARFLLLQRGALSFQMHARGYLARKRFQALLTPEMLEYLRRKNAVKVIQRYWRGYMVRKRYRNGRILCIRQTIKELQQRSSAGNSIRWKVQNAVRMLRGRFSVSEALHVLSCLDRLSRTVPHLLMHETDFISTFCYGIMAQAIRSEVDKQLIEYCSRIILNLARYNSSTANTFQKGGLVTIAQMLLRWCDKDSDIFNTLCTLIWVFSHCPQKRKIIHEYMSTPEAIYMIRETKKLVARKEKMKQNVRKPIVMGRGAPQTNFSSRALPSLEPDYGVIQSKPYIFISSVYAFDTILCRLGISLF